MLQGIYLFFSILKVAEVMEKSILKELILFDLGLIFWILSTSNLTFTGIRWITVLFFSFSNLEYSMNIDPNTKEDKEIN